MTMANSLIFSPSSIRVSAISSTTRHPFRRTITRSLPVPRIQAMNHMAEPNYVHIMDTTLRGVKPAPVPHGETKSYSELAQEIGKIGVDVIDIGYPSKWTLPGIAEGFCKLVPYGGRRALVISAMATLEQDSVQEAWDFVKSAEHPRVHIYAGVGDRSDQLAEVAEAAVAYAKRLGCKDIQFTLEDTASLELGSMHEVFRRVITAGAAIINLEYTHGTESKTIQQLIADVKENVIGESDENVIISVHVHEHGTRDPKRIATVIDGVTDDTIKAVRAGARQIEVKVSKDLIWKYSLTDGIDAPLRSVIEADGFKEMRTNIYRASQRRTGLAHNARGVLLPYFDGRLRIGLRMLEGGVTTACYTTPFHPYLQN